MDRFYRKLLTYSYNIVGSYEDAKDLVQDTIEKYIAVDKSRVQNEHNYLIRSVINHSINFKNRNKRTTAWGVWLPEPVFTESPDNKLLKENTARYSLLILMEKLNAKERAVFILKEAFEYSHDEIAETLGISSDNSRQLFSRAKRTLNQASFTIDTKAPVHLKAYIEAVTTGDIRTLKKLLMNDIRIYADGGNKIKVVKDFVMGKEPVMDLLLFVYNTFLKNHKCIITEVNHEPAICFYRNEQLYNCQVFELSGEKIAGIYSIVDPCKLKNLHS